MACAPVVGARVCFAEEPVALDEAHGAGAFRCRLHYTRGPAPMPELREDDAWGAPLFVRVASDRKELDREAAAMGLSRAAGSGAPVFLAILLLGAPGTPEPTWVLVSEAPRGVVLPELIGFNLHHVEALLRGFAANHMAVHRTTAVELGDRSAIPVVDTADEVARLDSSRFPRECEWVGDHLPEHRALVLCHGGYQPMCVYGPSASEWADRGGPGQGLTVANWSNAVLAEREFDVAFTLLAFWSAPFFAKNRAERAAIKMIRNTLLNTYMLGYTGYERLDAERLRFWRAFHALRGMARLQGAFDDKGSVFEAQDQSSLPDDLGPELQRYFRQAARTQ